MISRVCQMRLNRQNIFSWCFRWTLVSPISFRNKKQLSSLCFVHKKLGTSESKRPFLYKAPRKTRNCLKSIDPFNRPYLKYFHVILELTSSFGQTCHRFGRVEKIILNGRDFEIVNDDDIFKKLRFWMSRLVFSPIKNQTKSLKNMAPSSFLFILHFSQTKKLQSFSFIESSGFSCRCSCGSRRWIYS